ncbi:hypothetical protein BJY04DRAFT_216938 [Aspergillus karnatakaensis]|uniref:uncharacterized protein n=1 Tax=Aspergillus karnatakaensis TaxID=1810916 RepID=UPI003CCDC82D
MAVDPAILAAFGPPPPDVDLAESSVSVNNGAVIAMLCLAAVAVILRFTARVILRNALLYDDWTIIAALVGLLLDCLLSEVLLTKGLKICIGATTGISVAGGNVGSGKHVWAISLSDLMALYRKMPIQLLYSYTFLYATSCTAIRLSILFFYKRIFSPLEQTMKLTLAFALFITLSYPLTIWITMATACRPVTHFWTQFSGTSGECININSFFLALGIINMLNDTILLALPFPRLVKLQMTRRKKGAICGILAVGVFVCVASIVRIHYLSEFMNTADVTFLMGPVFIWSTIEPSVGIVCACLPHFAPLARIAHRSYRSQYQSRQSRTGGSASASKSAPSERPWVSHKYHSHSNSKQYSSSRMNRDKGTEEDEIGLTNYVTSVPGGNGGKYEAEEVRSGSGITVQSTFVQAESRQGTP